MIVQVGSSLRNEQELYRVPSDGGNFENVTHNPGYYMPLFWTPDGDWLLYAYGQITDSPAVLYGHLYRINVHSLDIQQLTPEPGYYELGGFYMIGG